MVCTIKNTIYCELTLYYLENINELNVQASDLNIEDNSEVAPCEPTPNLEETANVD